MKSLLSGLRAEPVATMAVVTAALGIAVFFGLDEKLSGLIGVLIGAVLAFPVRSGVTPNATAVKATQDAATEAALATANQLDAVTAGVKGIATEAGQGIAANVADIAANSALKLAGFSRSDRKVATP